MFTTQEYGHRRVDVSILTFDHEFKYHRKCTLCRPKSRRSSICLRRGVSAKSSCVVKLSDHQKTTDINTLTICLDFELNLSLPLTNTRVIPEYQSASTFSASAALTGAETASFSCSTSMTFKLAMQRGRIAMHC